MQFILALILIFSNFFNVYAQNNTETIIKKIRTNVFYKLTTPEEYRQIFSKPLKEVETKDGGMSNLTLFYSNHSAMFAKFTDDTAPYTIRTIKFDQKELDIAQNKLVVLQKEEDLKKFDDFWGYAGVSLEKLDLRNHYKILTQKPFDTQTIFPPKNKLPKNFNPERLITDGKYAGLGIWNLRNQGINGKGVSIAIIDQPLLLGHEEYTSNIVYYDADGLFGVEPQMHGSPVASIAVGKKMGVAPQAQLYYFATPTWKQDNKYYADALNKIIKINESKDKQDRIKVVSISFGGFEKTKNYKLWQQALKDAAKQNILVVTCNMENFNYGMAFLIDYSDPNSEKSYTRVRWSSDRPIDREIIFVPGGTRTIASHVGINVYTYERNGGMSWGAPYLAGLAALAYQVNPEISPEQIINYWKQSATPVEFGKLINPVGFIELVKNKE